MNTDTVYTVLATEAQLEATPWQGRSWIEVGYRVWRELDPPGHIVIRASDSTAEYDFMCSSKQHAYTVAADNVSTYDHRYYITGVVG